MKLCAENILVNFINRDGANNNNNNNNVVIFGSKLHLPDWVPRHNSGRTEKHSQNPQVLYYRVKIRTRHPAKVRKGTISDVHDMKVCRRPIVLLHLLLTSALAGGEWSPFHPGRLLLLLLW